ncbi:MAG: 6-phosphofructokinase [Bacteroidia bacterium]
MKNLAVLTSGGDAPGMNACIRAVVRTAAFHQVKVTGVMAGYQGLINGDFKELDATAVGNIIQKGGTILKTARSKEFMSAEGRAKAAEQMTLAGIQGLIVIGGDGSFRGADVFADEHPQFRVIGVPGTIDNDLYGTDFTIGYDTAINTVVEAVDNIRDTASSHNRLFFVEVMGRDAGLIALRSGIACGAEAILIPETETHLDKLIGQLEKGWQRQKSGHVIIVAEGDDDAGGAFEIARIVQEKFNKLETKVAVLGHIQRGGNPTCMDRVLATRLGYEATEALLQGVTRMMAGQVAGEINFIPLQKAVKHNVKINETILQIAEIMAL